jgi:hypothetical protein
MICRTRKNSDLSLTGWQIMALRSARLGGAPVPTTAVENAMNFVRRNYRDDQSHGLPKGIGGFVYTNSHYIPYRSTVVEVVNKQPSVGMTGVGLLCLELAGSHNSEQSHKAGNFILKMSTGKDLIDEPRFREYAIYYCAQGMFQLGGRYWDEFGERMYQYLLRTQDSNGAWSIDGMGEVYPTAMYVLALGVSYRQLPIYQR